MVRTPHKLLYPLSTVTLFPMCDLTSWTVCACTQSQLCVKTSKNTRCVCCEWCRPGGKSPIISPSSQHGSHVPLCPKYSDPSTHTRSLNTLMVNLRLIFTLRSCWFHVPPVSTHIKVPFFMTGKTHTDWPLKAEMWIRTALCLRAFG